MGVGLLENLEANLVAADLAGDRPRVPVPRGPAAVAHPVAAVAGAGADRVGRGLVAIYAARHRAQPDDRGRRPAGGRRLHRVHVADPAALPRGAPSRARAAARPSTSPRRAPAGPSSCRP